MHCERPEGVRISVIWYNAFQSGSHDLYKNVRTGPRHPRLGAAAFYLTLPLLEQLYARGGTFRPNSRFAENRLGAVRQQLKSGETVYLAGIGVGDAHKGTSKNSDLRGFVRV
jgi:hypothetical protein